MGGAAGAAHALGLEVRDLTPQRVREFVLSFGVWAPAAYLLGLGQPLIPLPVSIVIMAAGLLFGPVFGTLAALMGAITRACTQFLIARWLGREAVTRLLKGRLAALNQRIGRDGFKAVLLIRTIPNVPFDLQNYSLGVSHIRFGPYVLGTFVGILVPIGAFVYLGDSLTDPRQLWKGIAVVALVVTLPAASRLWQRRAASRALL